MKVESGTFIVPIRFYATGGMYVTVDGMNTSIDDDYTLTMENGNCTKTISLTPPTAEEMSTGTGFRAVTYLCIP
ncbi:unnamed protein product [Schistosoma turkestanicum]|nr:unnamed protein product [Schistosoma turkestanicum]